VKVIYHTGDDERQGSRLGGTVDCKALPEPRSGAFH